MPADIVEMAQQAISAHLRAERARADLTQSELAELTGIHVTTLSRLEKGKLSMTLDQLLRLAPALGIDPGDFLNSAQRTARKKSGK